MNNLIEQAYDPEAFRKNGHALIDQLADYIQAGSQGLIQPVLPWVTPEEQVKRWPVHPKGGKEAHTFFTDVLKDSHHLHHPQYMGHQVAVPAPSTILAGMLGKLLNNGMAIYEMGPVPSALEYNLARWIAPYFGWDESSSGFLTSGGTLANLTALLAARKKQVSPDSWKEGTSQKLAIMVSEQAHYCVDRAVRIMGWGSDGIIKIPTDEQFRMRIELLPQYLEEAQQNGIQVIAIIGSACTTSTGTYDDLSSIASFCQKNELWFHVDGAHGACVAFSKQYQHYLKGLEKADSLVMDFHKMLLVPALATGLFFRTASDSFATFSQEAYYLWSKNQDQEWHNFAKRTFECTKTMMVLQIQVLLEQYGVELWQQFVDRCYQLGQRFGAFLQERPHWELAVPPDGNIVCFRLRIEQHDTEQLNRWLRERTLEEGRFYIVQTVLRGETYLRVTLISPYTEMSHLRDLIEYLEGLAATYPGEDT
ncbi:MAG: aminotransferase class I/II-fold pyridoxal phosphate-dependent enzyme [Bacteroidota bacterium]